MADGRITRFTFPGSAGDPLAARLDVPKAEPVAAAVFAHCFTCGKDIAAASRVSKGLLDRGFAVLRFDFTGLGASDGEFANTNFTSNVDDLVAAAAAVNDELGSGPSVLVGHSLGGAAVLAAAPQIESVRAVATIGAPADPAHVAGLFTTDDLDRISTDGEAEVQLAGRPFTVRRQFLDDISGQQLEQTVGGLRRALLVMHSPIDNTVGVEHAARIFAAARHPKSFVAIDGADHLLADRNDATFVADVLAAWAARYV